MILDRKESILVPLLMLGLARFCLADAFVIAPDPRGTIGHSNETGTIYSFLIKQISIWGQV